MKLKWQIFLKWTVRILGIAAIIAIVFAAMFIYKILNEPFMDDGPFLGITRNSCELSKPYSAVTLPNGATLESFLPTNTETAPTVLLRTKTGAIKWCIYVNGFEKSSVKSIKFHTVQSHGFNKSLVKATVDWTFGNERSLWYLDSQNQLIHYWFSW